MALRGAQALGGVEAAVVRGVQLLGGGVVHVDEEADPPRVPESVPVDPSHIVASIPAEAVAAVLMVSVIRSLTALQGPEGSSLNIVSTTEPALISAEEGV